VTVLTELKDKVLVVASRGTTTAAGIGAGVAVGAGTVPVESVVGGAGGEVGATSGVGAGVEVVSGGVGAVVAVVTGVVGVVAAAGAVVGVELDVAAGAGVESGVSAADAGAITAASESPAARVTAVRAERILFMMFGFSLGEGLFGYAHEGNV
jgi:hypothetical protein